MSDKNRNFELVMLRNTIDNITITNEKNEDKFGEYFDNTILNENNNSNVIYSFSKGLSKNGNSKSSKELDLNKIHDAVKRTNNQTVSGIELDPAATQKLDGIFDGNSVNTMGGGTHNHKLESNYLYPVDSDKMAFELKELFLMEKARNTPFTDLDSTVISGNSENSFHNGYNILNNSLPDDITSPVINDKISLFRGNYYKENNNEDKFYLSDIFYSIFTEDNVAELANFSATQNNLANTSQTVYDNNSIGAPSSTSVSKSTNKSYVYTPAHLISAVDNSGTLWYKNAALMLKNFNVSTEINYSKIDNRYSGGIDDILSSLDHVANNASRVCSHSKWFHTMRMRPEELCNKINLHNTLTNSEILQIPKLNTIITKNKDNIKNMIDSSIDNSNATTNYQNCPVIKTHFVEENINHFDHDGLLFFTSETVSATTSSQAFGDKSSYHLLGQFDSATGIRADSSAYSETEFANLTSGVYDTPAPHIQVSYDTAKTIYGIHIDPTLTNIKSFAVL